MGNLNCIGPSDFAEDHHKKGYKELGWAYVKINREEGRFYLTEPWKVEVYSAYRCSDGEWLVWEDDVPIAELKEKEHADWLMDRLVKGDIT